MEFKNINIHLTVNIENINDFQNLKLFKEGDLVIPSFFEKNDFENILKTQIYQYYDYEISSYEPSFGENKTIGDLFPDDEIIYNFKINLTKMRIKKGYIKIHITYEYLHPLIILDYYQSYYKRKEIYTIIQEPKKEINKEIESNERDLVINAVLNETKDIKQYPNICTKINDNEKYHYYCVCNNDYTSKLSEIPPKNQLYLFLNGTVSPVNPQNTNLERSEFNFGSKSTKLLDQYNSDILILTIKKRNRNTLNTRISKNEYIDNIVDYFLNASDAKDVLSAVGNDYDLVTGFCLGISSAREKFKQQNSEKK